MNRRKILLERVNRGYNRGVLDVIPPNRKSGRTSKRRTNETVSQDDGRIVELNWQLPARLRRPIKEDLERERRKRRQREAIVKFERRPLRTQLPTEKITVAKTRTATGVEQHTADVYRQASPKLKVMMPPYGGGFVRRGGASAMMSRPSVKARKTIDQNVGSRVAGDVQRRMVIKPVKQRKNKTAPSPIPVASRETFQGEYSQGRFGGKVADTGASHEFASMPRRKRRSITTSNKVAEEEVVAPERVVSIAGERDVPFDWKSLIGEEGKKEIGEVSVEPPRRRFSLPLHFSVWPFSESRQVATVGESKKKVRRRKLIM